MTRKVRGLFSMGVIASMLLASCEESGVEENNYTSVPTITLSEENGIFETKINKTITISPEVSDAVDAFYVWKCDGEVISRDKTLEFCSAVIGEFYLTFGVDAANGVVEKEVRIDVLLKTPPQVTMPLTTGYIRATVSRDTEIVPTYKYCDEATYSWYIDGEFMGDTETLTVNKDEINDFTIRLDVENEDGFTRVEETLRVSEVPSLAFDFCQESYNVALGNSIVIAPYVSYATDATTYSWSVNGTTQSDVTNKYFKFTPSATGSYELKITGVGEENNAEQTVTVHCVEAVDYFRAITSESTADQVTVYEFTAAPGQFINNGYTVTTAAEAAAYAEGNFNANSMVSLGAWGGYVIVGFDHSVTNKQDAKDLWVGGNAFATSNEPAIVWVMQDVNGDGLPNDIWYEVKGSEYGLDATNQEYVITYYSANQGEDVRWTDNQGDAGTVAVNSFHSQNYFPAWIDVESYSIMGTRLKSRTVNQSDTTSEYWDNAAFDWGYADNMGSDYANSGTELDIDNAVNKDGSAAMLTHIDFVKVQAAVNYSAGWLGELSPEITGFKDLNF